MSKVTKGVSDFTVEFADNGFVLRYSGRDNEDNWADCKMIVPSLTELIKEIEKVVELR